MKAGFSEIDITPAAGVKKIGWMADLACDVVLDPLHARTAVFDDGVQRLAFIQLDTLSVRWTQVNRIRRRIESEYGFPGAQVMVSATHNHAGPALAGVFPVPRDDAYAALLEARCVAGFGQALAALEEADLGFMRRNNFVVAHNRRSRMRDGTVRCQVFSTDPLFLCREGPMDPEVAVLAARSRDGRMLGCLVNYACHPTHHGGTNEVSAGFPGVMARRMNEVGCPVTLYLNGAYGNVITVDFDRGVSLTKEQAGESLAADVADALRAMTFGGDWPLSARQETLSLDYRAATDDELHGRVFGAQRFRDDALYEDFIRRWQQRVRERGTQPADIQVLSIGHVFYAGVPAEYFVDFQLRIKEQCHPRQALVVGGANGMIGYVPTREAFLRGGYETTLGPPSKMAPDTGDRIADRIIAMIRNGA